MSISRITTHVLDAGPGRPAAGVAVELFARDGDAWSPIADGTHRCRRPDHAAGTRRAAAGGVPAAIRHRRVLRRARRRHVLPRGGAHLARRRRRTPRARPAAAEPVRLFHLSRELTMSEPAIVLGPNQYGKAEVRVVKVTRDTARHLRNFRYQITTLIASALIDSPSSLHAVAVDSPAQQISKDFIAVAKSSIPAVVSIQVKSVKSASNLTEQLEDPFNDEFFRFFFNPKRDLGQQKPTVGQASGFIISAEGYVLTNSHVVKDTSEIKVILTDGREFIGKVVGQDPNTDVAVVKIEADKLPFLRFADSDAIEIGQWAIAIGNPFGLQASLTVGVVSAKGRNNLELANVEDFIRNTTQQLIEAILGGLWLDIDAKVIGMNTAIVSNNGSGGYMGIGFAIPSNILRHITDQLIQSGSVTRGFIGVTLQHVDQDLAQAFGLKQIGGAVIADVAKGSPAEKAGLKQGDIVRALNKQPVLNIASLRNAIALMTPGTRIGLSILRNGNPMEVTVEVGAYPTSAKAALKVVMRQGFEVQELTPEVAHSLDADEGGVMISKMDPNSPAAWAGLKKGTLFWL